MVKAICRALAVGGLHFAVFLTIAFAFSPDRTTGPIILAIVLASSGFASAETWAQARAQTDDQGLGHPLIWAAGLVLLLLLLVCLFDPWRADPVGWWPPVVWTYAALLIAGGIGVRVLSIGTLGRRFRTDVVSLKPRELQTDGIYAHIRHPSETGLLAYALGICVLALSPMGLALFAFAFIPLTWMRIRREERALLDQDHLRYGDYIERVPALLPFSKH